MRVSSGIIYDLARSTDTAEVGAHERHLLIPPQVAPVISLQHALGDIDPTGSLIRRTSFTREFESFQTGAQVGASTTIAIMVEGLWDVWAAFTHITDLAEAITIDPRAGLQIIDPRGGTTRLLIALAGTHQTAREARWRFLFPNIGNWLLTHFVEATVVGQERYAHSALVCNRLL